MVGSVREKAGGQAMNNRTTVTIKPSPFFEPANMPAFSHKPDDKEIRITVQRRSCRVLRRNKKSKALPWTLKCRLIAGDEIEHMRLAHFVTNGQRRKGQRHHKRHGKNNRVHISIKSSRTLATVLLQ
jgi:hypothetical protein